MPTCKAGSNPYGFRTRMLSAFHDNRCVSCCAVLPVDSTNSSDRLIITTEASHVALQEETQSLSSLLQNGDDTLFTAGFHTHQFDLLAGSFTGTTLLAGNS